MTCTRLVPNTNHTGTCLGVSARRPSPIARAARRRRPGEIGVMVREPAALADLWAVSGFRFCASLWPRRAVEDGPQKLLSRRDAPCHPQGRSAAEEARSALTGPRPGGYAARGPVPVGSGDRIRFRGNRTGHALSNPWAPTRAQNRPQICQGSHLSRGGRKDDDGLRPTTCLLGPLDRPARRARGRRKGLRLLDEPGGCLPPERGRGRPYLRQ